MYLYSDIKPPPLRGWSINVFSTSAIKIKAKQLCSLVLCPIKKPSVDGPVVAVFGMSMDPFVGVDLTVNSFFISSVCEVDFFLMQ